MGDEGCDGCRDKINQIDPLGLLLGDIAMTLVDPRISFTKKGGAR